jgi:hypothetical protein
MAELELYRANSERMETIVRASLDLSTVVLSRINVDNLSASSAHELEQWHISDIESDDPIHDFQYHQELIAYYRQLIALRQTWQLRQENGEDTTETYRDLERLLSKIRFSATDFKFLKTFILTGSLYITEMESVEYEELYQKNLQLRYQIELKVREKYSSKFECFYCDKIDEQSITRSLSTSVISSLDNWLMTGKSFEQSLDESLQRLENMMSQVFNKNGFYSELLKSRPTTAKKKPFVID